MERIAAFVKRHWDILVYLFFGGLTTAVNYLVYLPCFHFLAIPAAVSNVIAWVVAVTFAFLTNKPLVFRSHDWSAAVVFPELAKFVGCRVGSGLLETAILFVFVDCLSFSGLWVKLFTSVMVVVLNYFGSKLLVFRRK